MLPPWQRPPDLYQGALTPAELEAIEQSLDKDLSCIGLRQLCLRNLECHEAFRTFQEACTIKRDSHHCIASDRYVPLMVGPI